MFSDDVILLRNLAKMANKKNNEVKRQSLLLKRGKKWIPHGSESEVQTFHRLCFLSELADDCSESQKTDTRANNYLSQVAALIVRGWRMSEEVCVCLSEHGMSFWPCSTADTHRETVLCPQTRGLLSPDQAPPITPPSPTETKGSRGWVTRTRLGASSLVEEGSGGDLCEHREGGIFESGWKFKDLKKKKTSLA